MSVSGSKEGIKNCNKISNKVEPIVDVEKLKSVYLFGIVVKDADGNVLPDSAYQTFIDNAVSMLEHDLDISMSPVIGEVEYKDYRLNDYKDWGFMYLNNYPVISLTSLEMVFYKDDAGGDLAVQQIPDNWIRLQRHDGIIRLVPNSRFPASLQVGAHGFFPELLKSTLVPHAWKITYDHGFEDGCVPKIINNLIAGLAAMQVFQVAGSLVLGAGIASSSLGIDGLSQSINTTQSAENSAFSAQYKEYQNLIFGRNEKDPGLLGKVRAYYKGAEWGII